MHLRTLPPLLLLLVAGLEDQGARAACPAEWLIRPYCTCRVLHDKYKAKYPILTCRKLDSEDDLMRVLDVIRGDYLFEFQLVDSNLRYIPHKAFVNTTFKFLNFENSSITALSDNNLAFEGLETSLYFLEIVNCSIQTEWNWSQLAHLKSLMEVMIVHTDILEISDDISSIYHLDFEAFVFEQNNIERLDSHAFAPFKLLERLSLDNNNIKHISRTMFPQPAYRLKILSLSYNKLTSLPKDIFDDMPAMSSLHLTGNPLTVMDEATFMPIWSHLNLVFFYHTQLVCDCNIQWITKANNTQKCLDIRCHKPEELKERNAVKLQPYEFNC